MLDNLFWYRIPRVGCLFWDVDLGGEVESPMKRAWVFFFADFSHLEANLLPVMAKRILAFQKLQKTIWKSEYIVLLLICIIFFGVSLLMPLWQDLAAFETRCFKAKAPPKSTIFRVPWRHETGDLPWIFVACYTKALASVVALAGSPALSGGSLVKDKNDHVRAKDLYTWDGHCE